MITVQKDKNLLGSDIEQTRRRLSKNIDPVKKSQYGQFFTPEKIATFMASLFPSSGGVCRLLDAGAGIGSLTASFLDRWRSGGFDFRQVELDAFEIDSALQTELSQTLSRYQGGDFFAKIHHQDFIHSAVDSLSDELFVKPVRYTHVILNPPYKKITQNSDHRQALRKVGLDTVNLYSAFVALSVALAAPGGQIVAIIPRSFCNGPYYRPFRDFIFKHTALRLIHLFDSRQEAFKDDSVLQENIIIHLERNGKQGAVTVSTSTDATFADLAIFEQPFDQIVLPNDPERFIHIPTSTKKNIIEISPKTHFTLVDLGIMVSTGPVVGFRMRNHLRDMPDKDTVPLLYPAHFSTAARWPGENIKKPNAIAYNSETKKLLYPTGYYCVVRRFSSKEEKRRVVASVVEPDIFGGAAMLGFDNHLNVFHLNKCGLSKELAYGLALYLNTTAVDDYFRSFSGHTQVNATDLRQMKYPSYETLVELGQWRMQKETLTQNEIDRKTSELWF